MEEWDPSFVINGDISLLGWGAVANTNSKLEDFGQSLSHINVLELKAMYLAFLCFCKNLCKYYTYTV